MHDLLTYFLKLKIIIRRRLDEHLPLSSDPSNAVLGHQIRFYFGRIMMLITNGTTLQ